MNCVAIWCSGTVAQTVDHSLEVHFNLWKLGEDRCFLDIGLMLQPAESVGRVNIFVPQTVAQSHVEDLGIVFRENPDLVSSLFNEEYRVSSRADEKTIDVQDANRTPVFRIYALDMKSDVTIEDAYGGSIIKIRIPREIASEKHYYRIRLKNPYVDSISHIYTPPNSMLESAFFQTELVDFRLNEKRNLHKSLLERMRSEGRTCFSKTHLFLMRAARDDYVYSHKPPIGSRQLEPDLWKEYVRSNYLFDRMIAYHWKASETHSSFSAFAKFKTMRCTKRTVAVFVLGVVAIGILTEILANWLAGFLPIF